jgi:hypothetical protein
MASDDGTMCEIIGIIVVWMEAKTMVTRVKAPLRIFVLAATGDTGRASLLRQFKSRRRDGVQKA